MSATWAVVFPGQAERDVAAQLAKLFAREPAWAALLEGTTSVAASEWLAQGGRALERTELYQPAMVALCLDAWARFSATHEVAFVAGHSLGEVTAWAVVHVVGAQRALELAWLRGVGMAAIAREVGGGLALVARFELDEVLALAHAAGGRACLALENSRDTVVLSGDACALRALGHRVRRLPGQGPWHGPWLAPVERALRAALLSVYRAPSPTWVGEGDLAARVCEPVRWVATVDELCARGVTDIAIAGPGRAQRALLRELVPPSVNLHLVDDDAPLTGAVHASP